MPTQTISRCGGSVSGFVSAVLSTNPDALWPLNEVSGTTAYDALSGHHDAFASPLNPTFAADTSPVGTPAPSFLHDQNFGTTWTPTMAGDFSVACFAKAMADGVQTAMSFNSPVGAFNGWALGRGVLSSPSLKKFLAEIGDGVTTQALPSDASNTAGTWYWLALTRASGLFTFYINGAAQATTYSGTYVSGGAAKIYMGYPVGTGSQAADIRLAYCAVWTTRALSASEVAGIWLNV